MALLQRREWGRHISLVATVAGVLIIGACGSDAVTSGTDSAGSAQTGSSSVAGTVVGTGAGGGNGGSNTTSAGGEALGGFGGEGGQGGSPCVPESDTVFCQNHRSACGSTSGTNQCGDDTTVNCGSCPSLQTCGANAQPNQCGVDGWDISTLDATGDVGLEISMALSAAGEPSIAYRRDDVKQLRVASRLGGVWSTETLDTATFAGIHTAIAFAPDGAAHVAATSFEGLNIWRLEAGTWMKETITSLSRGRVGLAFDAGGDPHICVHNESVETLYYWTRSGTSPWQSEIVDGGSPSSAAGDYCSIGVGSDGRIHISYQQQQFLRLKYATKPANGTWSTEVVDDPPGEAAGSYTAIALDSMNNPHIAYRSGLVGYKEIRLVDHVGAIWNSDVADTDAGSLANYTSLALSSSGTPHLSYYSTSIGGQLRYNTNPGNGWTATALETVGTGSGGYNAIAVGANQVVHIAYYNATMQALRYATNP